MVTSAFPPETSQELYADSLKLLGGTTVCGIFYGIMTVLAAACVHAFFHCTPRGGSSRLRLAAQVGYVALLWVSGTLYMACLARTSNDVYVVCRLQLQSPSEWSDFQSPEYILGDTAYVVAHCLADGLLVWRFRAVWHNSKWYRYLLPCAVLLYLAVIALDFMAVINNSLPGHSFYSTVAYKMTAPSFVASVVLNLYTTSLIAGRLYVFRRWLVNTVGKDFLHPKHFTNIAGIVVESCALFTVTSIIFMGTYVARHPAFYVMIAVLSQVQIIAPLLVILRMSWGIAWEPDVTMCTAAIDVGHVLQRDDDCHISVIPNLRIAACDSVKDGSDTNV
ncbi:hypothetical protein CONPUDRAFT_155775 [Coniophora puteana RWD-64-598 SS2]|uniref:Uncharacterized protein n=1 Tax=Coniophora puteana (strain RWD-64-598) TaxID=741705 RepID=A0A5M3MJV2_CONPW|nr:uncharacterized protein CONPUDRAFT_155775 [Coniophora puteana RWD-64-598 SS2]EIW79084.1 hypothetical protein CONPUDRAFT_155775 [Coniophora puteana RWD-64-598 SS2]